MIVIPHLRVFLLGVIFWLGIGESRCGDVLREWRALDSIPDEIGYNGMWAAVFDDKLIAAGGSNFPSPPLWAGGSKEFSDRIFVLSGLNGRWQESPVKLPYKVASPASSANEKVAYIAGGLNAQGCLTDVLAVAAEKGNFIFTRLPSLPEGLAYACAGVASGRLFVVGGIMSAKATTASAKVWSLSLDAEHDGTWQREPDVPGNGVFVATLASDGDCLYLFGGATFDEGGAVIPLDKAYSLRTGEAQGQWQPLPALPEARVSAASPSPVVSGGMIFLVGGYSQVFPGPLREHPGFPATTYLFDIATQKWGEGPRLPQLRVANRDLTSDAGPAPVVGAPLVQWKGQIILIGGETRPSVRTPAVIALPIDRNR